MPIYEFRCRACGATFDELRPADRADDSAVCGCGADDTVRLLSLIARPTGAAPAGDGGGCCGGGCCG